MRGPFPFWQSVRALALALACATPAIAQDDAGVSDAGPGACDPRCEGDTLHFCDGDTPVELDCRDLGCVFNAQGEIVCPERRARCGLLSAEWGDDCVLGAGTACDPDYAFGASRCDRAASLYCVDGVCAEAAGPPGEEPEEEPTPGTEVGLETASTNPFGCTDCGSGQAAALLPALVLLRLRPLRKMRRRR